MLVRANRVLLAVVVAIGISLTSGCAMPTINCPTGPEPFSC